MCAVVVAGRRPNERDGRRGGRAALHLTACSVDTTLLLLQHGARANISTVRGPGWVGGGGVCGGGCVGVCVCGGGGATVDRAGPRALVSHRCTSVAISSPRLCCLPAVLNHCSKMVLVARRPRAYWSGWSNPKPVAVH